MLITGREGSGKLVASLSAGTVIRKETKEPNNRVLLGALLLGCLVVKYLHVKITNLLLVVV